MQSEPSPSQPVEDRQEGQPTASTPVPSETIAATPRKPRSRLKHVGTIFVSVVLLYLVVAYLVMPAFWKRYLRRHPSLEDIPRITHTKGGIPGDPLNVALIGTEAEVKQIMRAAKWYEAAPLSWFSSVRIAADSVFDKAYNDAPVSNLYLFGRKEDLAFEKAVGNNPRKRHHVRFWRTTEVDEDGRPVWVGSAIFDDRVGVSLRTGQITHHTAADIDTERDTLFRDLRQTGDLAEEYIVEGFHKVLRGRNGGGDPWHTDGNLYVGVIKSIEASSN
jgi:hypothetical protein